VYHREWKRKTLNVSSLSSFTATFFLFSCYLISLLRALDQPTEHNSLFIYNSHTGCVIAASWAPASERTELTCSLAKHRIRFAIDDSFPATRPRQLTGACYSKQARFRPAICIVTCASKHTNRPFDPNLANQIIKRTCTSEFSHCPVSLVNCVSNKDRTDKTCPCRAVYKQNSQFSPSSVPPPRYRTWSLCSSWWSSVTDVWLVMISSYASSS